MVFRHLLAVVNDDDGSSFGSAGGQLGRRASGRAGGRAQRDGDCGRESAVPLYGTHRTGSP